MNMRYGIFKRAAVVSLLIAEAALVLPLTSFAGTPTLNCGDGFTIAGSDTAGKVTVGTESGTCVLTFSTPYANPPACMAMNETNGGGFAAPVGTKTTTTTLVLGGMNPWSVGDVVSYLCQGY
jgi:hypothetical protein